MDDWQLIQAYVEQKSESAFRVLVERYTNLVYSAALRQASDSQLAQEIAQTVFILLAQKSKTFRADVILPGWLFRTTRFVASRAIRSETRRQRREQEAYQMQELQTPDAVWLQMAPCLDEALSHLGQTERDAIILRYFQGKELRTVGVALGLSQEATRKRITRGVDKLRSFFADRGYSISAALIVATLGANGVKAAPAGLSGSFVASALSTAAIGSATVPLVMEVIAALRWAKLKALGLGVVGGLATLALIYTVISLSTREQITERAVSTANDVEITTLSRTQNLGLVVMKGTNAASVSEKGTVLRLKVVAADNGEAVVNARVGVHTVIGESWRTREGFSTDASGWCEVPYPTSIGRLDVGLIAHGWGARFVTWTPPKDPIPREYILKVERLTNSVGGFLVDGAGAPVANADILIGFGGTGDSFSQETPRERAGFINVVNIGKSDENGRWSAKVIPTEHKGFYLRAKHPNFAETAIAGVQSGENENEDSDIRKMRAGTLVTKMKPSFTFSGRVLNEAGEPIEGARITEETQRTVFTTSGDGWFHVPKLNRGNWEFTVSAKNFAPKRASVTVDERMELFEVRLAVGGVVRFKVVGLDGMPIEGVTVGLEQWGKDRHILDWKAKSDTNGQIEWRSAPPKSQLEFYARKTGYCYTREVRLEADDNEQIVQMRRALKVVVRAVDAETGTPIRAFKAYPGYGDDEYAWEKLRTVHSKNGAAEVVFEENKLPWRVRVEAEGFEKGTSEPIVEKIGELAEITFTLGRINPVKGVVYQPDGRVAEGADVAVCTIEQSIGVELMKFHLRQASLSVLEKTDATGKFSFTADPTAHTIVVAHPSGFARVRVRKETEPLDISLKPWGKIEGTVRLAASAAQATVVLSDWASAQYNGGLRLDEKVYSANVGLDGRFTIDPAPPGAFFLALKHGKNSPDTQKTGISVAAVKVTMVELGSSNNDVIGRLVTPIGVPVANWKQQSSAQLTPLFRDKLQTPFGLEGNALKMWEVDFWQSEAGHLRLLRGQNIPLLVQEDGSFQGFNVPPGSYRLTGGVRDEATMQTVAYIAENIVVPESSESGFPTMVDLGNRTLTPFKSQER